MNEFNVTVVSVIIDDWLAIYTDSNNHQYVRNTEKWPEWNTGHQTGDYEPCIEKVLKKAKRIGPPNHDTHWCAKCNADLQ